MKTKLTIYELIDIKTIINHLLLVDENELIDDSIHKGMKKIKNKITKMLDEMK